jgi:Asp-tRNA(Asn)/Glu-tRNA(Gln) amidotransferase A subunit family amidase
MKAGQLTSRRLVEMYLERIKQVDTKTRSVLELNPDALLIADQMDKERKKGKLRSQLHGIPVLIKGQYRYGRQDAHYRRVSCTGRRSDAKARMRLSRSSFETPVP